MRTGFFCDDHTGFDYKSTVRDILLPERCCYSVFLPYEIYLQLFAELGDRIFRQIANKLAMRRDEAGMKEGGMARCRTLAQMRRIALRNPLSVCAWLYLSATLRNQN